MKKSITEAAHGEVELYANPYDTSKKGFHFTSKEDFDAKYEKNLPVEEYEIEFIDGSKADADLWEHLGNKISQSNLDVYFDKVVPLEDHGKAALYHSLDVNGDLDSALDSMEDYGVTEGTIEEYAKNYISEMYPDNKENKFLLQYFDYERFARDLQLGGDMTEFEFAGTTYTANNQ